MTPLAPDHTVDNELLDRYIAGECTAQEAQRVQRWLSDQPAMRTVVAELRTDSTQLSAELSDSSRATIDTDWQRVLASMNMGTSVSPIVRGAVTAASVPSVITPQHRLSRHVRTITAVAAAAVLAIAVGVGVFGPTSTTSSFTHASRTFVTRAGERATVNLADGSYVMLGPLSTLTVTPAFGSQTRTLKLQGSGFFSVTPNAELPFIVDAGRARVQVLGTSFGVRSYPDEEEIMVAVRTGRVAITDTIATARRRASDIPPLIASANDVARIDLAGSTVTRRGEEANDVLAWTEGRLVFRDVPLGVVLVELSRWYDVSFRVTDPALWSLPITGGFSNRSVDELSEALSFILPVRVIHSGRVFTIAPRE